MNSENRKTEKTFWVVWSQLYGLRGLCHPTLAAARGEAQRLAAESVGQEFIVLQAVGKAVVPREIVPWVDYDDCPF